MILSKSYPSWNCEGKHCAFGAPSYNVLDTTILVERWKKMDHPRRHTTSSATATATSNGDFLPQSRSNAPRHNVPLTAGKADPGITKRTTRRSKYRHVEAYHSKLRHSSLSRDSGTTTSFLGFRNLMVIVLGRIASELAVLVRG